MFKVYIPARYASSRLPGKSLLPVAGKTIVEHVFLAAQRSGASDVVIATDDARIEEVAQGFGAQVVMTAASHTSGTDRIAEAVDLAGEPDDLIVVNVQGDEPLMPAAVIEQVAATLGDSPNSDMATVCEPVESWEAVDDPNVVKVVRDADNAALYFSRAAIPYARDGRHTLDLYRRHVGIYAYRVRFLRRFVASAAGELESSEQLEQLRALANGARILVPDAVMPCGIGVDTPDDYTRLKLAMNNGQ